MNNSFRQYRETDPLQKVIIGRWKGYRRVEEYVEKVNQAQQSGLPTRKKLEAEFAVFTDALQKQGIEVLSPEYVGKFVYDQLTPRDIGVTIGDKFVICNMARGSRRYEAAGIFKHVLSMEGPEPVLLIPPSPHMLMEGGDIIIDKGFLFVGITRRTNEAGFNFLKAKFGHRFKVVPVPCKEEVLHLDCVFNPVGLEHALIYPAGMKRVPKEIEEHYRLIEVDKAAQRALATNVLSVRPDLVFSRKHPDCHAANEAMRKAGLEVTTFLFDGAPATGGGLRCCSLPLVRGE